MDEGKKAHANDLGVWIRCALKYWLGGHYEWTEGEPTQRVQ